MSIIIIGEIGINHNGDMAICKQLIDVSRLSNMGWNYSVSLEEGLIKTYNWYLESFK